MRPVRALIADESPVMRRWYAAALQRTVDGIDECESGWELLYRLSLESPCGLVVASRSLRGFSGSQVLAMLRAASADVPFVLVAPFCDGSVRSLVARLPNAALIEDSLDAVHLAETAAALLTSSPRREPRTDEVRRALASYASVSARRMRPRRAFG
jgi:DNA-binding NtrC family response regulator